MQAAEITSWKRRNGPVRCYMTLFAAIALQCVMQQNEHSVATGVMSAQRVFVPGDLDL